MRGKRYRHGLLDTSTGRVVYTGRYGGYAETRKRAAAYAARLPNRDNLAVIEIVAASAPGRPSVGGVLLGGITVSPELLDGLQAASARLGLSLAQARREAYADWVRASNKCS